ncbi:MAG TPA: ZIP family metal transporter [Elusimicrobiota bacterium]|nr:ZIP family metal transporter [Elusimicrobiota bacterium]
MPLPLTFSLISVFATLGGGWLLLGRKEWTLKYLWRFLAFGSGVIFGITFLHLIPESWRLDSRWGAGSLLVAFVTFYALEEFVVAHHACGELTEDCHEHKFGYGALVALFLHSLSDGLAMAFSFLSSTALGVGVSTAVIVHKFSDGMTLSSLFLNQGFSRKKIWALTSVLSIATPLGLMIGLSATGLITPTVLAVLLGLAAGSFLYVAMADILPRLHHNKDIHSWILFLVGIGLSALYPH